MRLLNRVGLLLGVVLVASTMSCATPAPDDPADSSASPAPVTDESHADASGEGQGGVDGEVDAPEPASDAAVCDDDAFTDAATIPPQLAELDVPFYACVHEMVAISDSDPLFVGEYDTSHESIVIEMSITNQFDASHWEVSERTVEGDNAITHAQKAGYTLVVAIGPSRSPGATSSVHYTLRAQ